MKKISLVLIIMLLPVLNIAADWTHVLSAGGTVPVLNIDVEDEAKNEDKMSAVGFDGYIDYMLVNNNNRFSLFVFESVGGINTDDIYYDDDVTGVHLAGMLGVGGALVNTDTAVVALHGVIGYSYFYFNEDVYSSGYSIETTVSGVYFALGANISTAFRFTDHFGMSIAVAGLVNLGGSGEIEGEYKNLSADKDFDIKAGKMTFLPRLGFAWFF